MRDDHKDRLDAEQITPRGIAPYTLDDYHQAPSGGGDLAGAWEDKPHRLLYELIAYAKRLQEIIDALSARLDKAHELDNRKTVALVDLRTALAPFAGDATAVTPDDFAQAQTAHEKPLLRGLGDELTISGTGAGVYFEDGEFYLALDNYKIRLIPHQAMYVAEELAATITETLKGDPVFAKTLRPPDYAKLHPSAQWAVDKRLHLLDGE